jgi:predicted NodU family carbamoyl transferase
MLILGINAYHGDVSAILLRDGELVAAVEEERFRRVKHWAGFPRESIRACLDMAGVMPKKDLFDKILTLYHDRVLTWCLGTNARQAALVFDRRLQVRAYYDLSRALVDAPLAHP